MSTVITESKLVSEDITLIVDFLSRMRLGETIATFTVGISVYSGADLSPVPTILSSSSTVDQVLVQLSGGAPGVIYLIDVAARTSLANVFVQEIKLAVLTSNSP